MRKSWQPPRAEVANVKVQVEQAATASEAIEGPLVDLDTVEFQARNLQCVQGLCEQSADMQMSAGQAWPASCNPFREQPAAGGW